MKKKTLYDLWNWMQIIYCYPWQEMCLYEKKDYLCYHWEDGIESAERIEEYAEDHNIGLPENIKVLISLQKKWENIENLIP